MSSKTDARPDRAWTAVLTATFLVAAALRLAALNSGLWYDEIVTLVFSARLPFREILTDFPGTNVHPLYSLLAHTSMEVFGESAWSLRLPACLFGIASVVFVYALGARLMGRVEAWAGAVVLATSYHHIWFSQNARGYTLLGLLALVSTFVLLQAGRSRSRRDYAIYAVVCAAGVYTHLTMVFVVAGQAAVIVFGRLAGWRPAGSYALGSAALAWSGAAALSAAAYAPYMGSLIAVLSGGDGPGRAVEVATASWAVGEAVRALLSGSGILAAFCGGVVATVGLVSLWRRQPLATALLVVPGVVTLLALLALGQPIRPRFFFPFAGAAAIFAGGGLGALVASLGSVRLVDRETRSTVAIVAGALLLVVASVPALVRNYQVPKQDFDGVVPYLETVEAAGADITAAGPACLPFESYYRKPWPCLVDAADWHAVKRGARRTLVAYTLADYVEDPALRELLRTECPVQRHFPGTLGGGDFVVCEAKS